MNIRTVSLLLVVAAAWAATSASAYQLSCPEFVESTTAAPPLKSVPSGWEAVSRENRLWLDGAVLTTDRPEKFMDLKPGQYRLHGKTYEWQLPKMDLTGVGVWFSCSYSHGQVLLTQRIEASLSACRLITAGKAPQLNKVILDCE